LAFSLETRETIRVLSERIGQNLDRNLTAELGVSGAPHLAHTTRTDLGGDFRRTMSNSSSPSPANIGGVLGVGGT
jgi:hypothetical protein